jgi:hypothetical protein
VKVVELLEPARLLKSWTRIPDYKKLKK